MSTNAGSATVRPHPCAHPAPVPSTPADHTAITDPLLPCRLQAPVLCFLTAAHPPGSNRQEGPHLPSRHGLPQPTRYRRARSTTAGNTCTWPEPSWPQLPPGRIEPSLSTSPSALGAVRTKGFPVSAAG